MTDEDKAHPKVDFGKGSREQQQGGPEAGVKGAPEEPPKTVESPRPAR